MGGCAPGPPGGGKCRPPSPGRLGAPFVAPKPAIVCAPARPRVRSSASASPSGSLFARSASCRAGAPAPALVRFGAARPPPLRGRVSAHSALASLPAPAPRPLPPGSGARPCAPLRGSCGARCRRCPGLALAALRAPVGRPCSVSGAALGLRVGPPGPPLPRPLRGFGGGWLPPRGPARPCGPLVWGLWPPGR